MNTRAESIARHMWDARGMRQKYENLPHLLTPHRLLRPMQPRRLWRGWPCLSVTGVKVAATEVMQQLMVSPPLRRAIFKTIHQSQRASEQFVKHAGRERMR
jgi:hypothetical protein